MADVKAAHEVGMGRADDQATPLSSTPRAWTPTPTDTRWHAGNDRPGSSTAMRTELGYTRWPLAVDGGGRLHDALGGQGMPTTAFYGTDRGLRFVPPGALAGDTLGGRIRDLFGLDTGGGG